MTNDQSPMTAFKLFTRSSVDSRRSTNVLVLVLVLALVLVFVLVLVLSIH